jgi:hypothetical protein
MCEQGEYVRHVSGGVLKGMCHTVRDLHALAQSVTTCDGLTNNAAGH